MKFVDAARTQTSEVAAYTVNAAKDYIPSYSKVRNANTLILLHILVSPIITYW
jgi:hypothetical protein